LCYAKEVINIKNMLTNIATYKILGLPLFFYGGLVAIVLLLITALVGILILKGKYPKINVHVWLARITIILALIHGAVALLSYL